jgi:hypothetical protein
LAVGIAVLVLYLWLAPEFHGVLAERPDYTILRPDATPIASFTPGASPTLPPLATPTLTPTPTIEPGFENRDNERRAHLAQIAQIVDAYFAATGSFPVTGINPQSLCVFPDLDAGCAFRWLAPGGELPQSPLGEPYRYYSLDGTSWVVLARLEEDVPESEQCPHLAAELFPEPDQLICVTGGAP